MTKLSPALSAESVCTYHAEQLGAKSAERSYMRADAKNAGGEWCGHVAEAWGIKGQSVTEEALERAANGRHILTNAQLIAHRHISEKLPEHIVSETAWRGHVEEILSEALLRGDLFNHPPRQEIETRRPKPETKEPKPETKRVYSETEQKLLEMHAIAQKLYEDNLWGDRGIQARAYLEKRGISSATAREFGLGLAVCSDQLRERLAEYGPKLMRESGLFVEKNGVFRDRFWDRLMIPIQDQSGNTIAFSGRNHPEATGPRYLNSPASALYDKSSVLWNFHRAKDRAAERGEFVVQEGFFSVMAAHQAGVTNTVALSGTAMGEKQAVALRDAAGGVVLGLDADEAGKRATARAVPLLMENGLAVRVMKPLPGLKEGQDAADWIQGHGRREYWAQVRGAKPLGDYLIREARSKFGLDDSAVGLSPEAAEKRLRAGSFAQSDAVKWLADMLGKIQQDQREAVSNQLHEHLGLKTPPNMEHSSTESHIAAWDCIISASKSVSISALTGGDKRIITAHEYAVKEALEYLERHMQVKTGANLPPQTTGKGLFALFQHDTARPVDVEMNGRSVSYAAPQLHTHALVFNMAPDAADKFRAINPSELFNIQSAVESVYQNSMAKRLKSFGYQLSYGKGNAVEIAGYTPEYLKAESPRTAAIEEEKRIQGRFGAAENQQIALETRKKKEKRPSAEIQAEHQQRAAQFGNQPAKVVAEAKLRKGISYSEKFRRKMADDAVQFAKSRLSERTSVMESFEIHRDALKFGRGYITLPDIESAFERAREKGEFIQVHHWRPSAPGERWTTPDLVKKEREILEFMKRGRDAVQPIAGPNGISKDDFREAHIKLASGNKLMNHQQWLVWRVANSRDRMMGVNGIAGSGKTTSLIGVKEFAEQHGFEVFGVAMTTTAVNEMREVGVNADTMAKFIQPWRYHSAKKPRLYVIDESSLVDVHSGAAFLKHMSAKDRVLVIGDLGQHSAINAGKMFAELQEAGMYMHRTKTIVRQKPAWYKKAVEKISEGDIAANLEILRDKERLHEEPNQMERYKLTAKMYSEAGPDSIVVAPDLASGAGITQAIRELRMQQKEISETIYTSRALDQRKDLTKTDMMQAFSYEVGNVVLFNSKNSTLKVKSGDYGHVLKSDHEKNLVTVMSERDGHVFTYNPKKAASNATLYETKMRDFSVGDRIAFSRTFQEWVPAKKKKKGQVVVHAASGALGTVQQLDRAGNIVVRLDKPINGKQLLSWNLEKFSHLQHGYTFSSYRSQGITANTEVIVSITTDMPGAKQLVTQEMGFVAQSRGRMGVQVVTDDATALEKMLVRHEQKAMALAPKEIAAYQASKARGRT